MNLQTKQMVELRDFEWRRLAVIFTDKLKVKSWQKSPIRFPPQTCLKRIVI